MSHDAAIDLIRRAYAAYAAGDPAAALAVLDPDVEIVQTPLLPWGGVHRGLEGARRFFGLLAEHTAAIPQPLEYIPAGEEIVAIGRLRGHARATGAPIDLAIAHVWTIRAGRVVRFVAYIDTPAMLRALGRAPATRARG